MNTTNSEREPLATAPVGADRDEAALDPALDPAGMLGLIQRQQQAVSQTSSGFVSYITLAWGLAWGLGYLALFLIDGVRPAFSLPVPVAASVFAGLIVAAIVVSIVLGVRSSNGVRASKANSFTGTVYGVTWSVSMTALYVIAIGFASQGLIEPGFAAVYFPVIFTVMTGIMFLVSAAIWQAIPALVLGSALVVAGVAGSFVPTPANYLYFALTGGGVFLAFTVWTRVWLHRTRRDVLPTASATGAR